MPGAFFYVLMLSFNIPFKNILLLSCIYQNYIVVLLLNSIIKQ